MNAVSKLFISAIEEKNFDELKRLIENGMKVNWMYLPQGMLPIVLAAESGDIDFCLAIVKLGAHLHAFKGLPSPLSIAVFLNSKKAVEVLIRLGCDVNENCIQKDWFKKAPSRVSEWLGEPSISLLRCPTSLSLAVLLRNYDIVTALLEAGADINKSDNDIENGVTPIHLMCEKRSSSCNLNRIIEYFRLRPYLSPKPDLNCQNKFGETPLMIASRSRNIEAVISLLEQKVDLNTETHYDQTALHYAAIGGSESEDGHESARYIIICLLRAGCVIDMPQWKSTPLDVRPSVNDQICEILVKCGADPLRHNGWSPTILHVAAKAGNMVLMNVAVRAGISVDTISAHASNTPLMLSPYCLVTTKYLIQQRRARLDLENIMKDTALQLCLRSGPPGVCAYLIIEGSPRCLESYRFAETKPRILELLLLTETSPLRDLISKYSANWKKYDTGWHESWTETKFYQLSHAMSSNVHSLKHLCRLVIRDALVKHSNGRGILLSIHCLPLPSILKKYICYHDELDRLRLSKILNTDDDDDDDVNIYNDNARHPNDLRYHRHRQLERPYDIPDDIPQETERFIDYYDC